MTAKQLGVEIRGDATVSDYDYAYLQKQIESLREGLELSSEELRDKKTERMHSSVHERLMEMERVIRSAREERVVFHVTRLAFVFAFLFLLMVPMLWLLHRGLHAYDERLAEQRKLYQERYLQSDHANDPGKADAPEKASEKEEVADPVANRFQPSFSILASCSDFIRMGNVIGQERQIRNYEQCRARRQNQATETRVTVWGCNQLLSNLRRQESTGKHESQPGDSEIDNVACLLRFPHSYSDSVKRDRAKGECRGDTCPKSIGHSCLSTSGVTVRPRGERESRHVAV